MAVNDKPQLLAGKIAETDLSAKQYHYVGKGTADNQVIIAGGAAGEVGYGWLMNKPGIGVNAEIAGPGGGCKVKLEGTVAANGQIMANANGKGIAATGAGAIVSAIAKQAGVTGDEIDAISVIGVLHA
jgi:hypothetical protein